MVGRDYYVDKLERLKDSHLIKVITGVRRCGKSTLMEQFQQHLLGLGVQPEQIVSLNFEKIEHEPLLEYHALYDYICGKLTDGRMTYVFLDEVQEVDQFQRVVDSLFVKDNVDLYVTGSNARMLSGELATLLSGRYVEIQLLPLSFAEYASLVDKDRKVAWTEYFWKGGFPYAATILDDDIWDDYLRGIYHTVLLKDIVERKKIQDVALLESVIRFLADNIGSIISPKKIADSMASNGRKTSPTTIEHYIQALCESYIFYRTRRYDVRGKQHLKSLEKYYLVDQGLRRLLLGDRRRDVGHILENIVFLELVRRGYEVSIGKVGQLEVDFVASRAGEREYFQVAATVMADETFEREIAPLRKIKDNYPKWIITMDELTSEEDGIRQVNVMEFLEGR